MNPPSRTPSPDDLSRRAFLRRSLFGATAAWTLPAFLGRAFEATAQTPTGASSPILLIVQQTGGNDSLNTVIPYSNSYYQAARPTIRLTPAHGAFPIGAATALNGTTEYQEAIALHPRLAKINALWNAGDVAIVNGVGYPNPNLSHFASFDNYHTARPNEAITDGWLGRFFDHQCAGCSTQTAFHLNDTPTLATRSLLGSSGCIASTDPRWLSWQYFNDRARSLENLYRKAIGVDHPVDAGIAADDEALAYVQRSAQAALLSSREVQARLFQGSAGFPHASFPGTPLGQKLKDVAQLIQGGLASSIYYVEQGGYDTHGLQIASGDPTAGTHANLLAELDGALGAFAAEMQAQGNWNRVLVVTFSEFGRKVPENGSLGTDHGAAETLFVLGGAVTAGCFGVMPDLAPGARVAAESMQHNVDFRRVYRTILEKWLQVPAAAMSEIFPSQPADFSLLGFV